MGRPTSDERTRIVPRGVRTSNASPSSENDSGPGVMSAGRLMRVGDRTAGQSRSSDSAARIVDVDQARRVARQHLEQPALGLEVLLHVGMEVEVVAGQIREDARRERHAVDAMQRQRVRRHFHRAGAAPAIDHLAQQRWTSGASGVVRVASRTSSPMR